MAAPTPKEQLAFLDDLQRILSGGLFVSTYKFALLLSLADLAVERGDDSGDELPLTARDVAERFVSLYWRQALPWVPSVGKPATLLQNTGRQAAILTRLRTLHAQFEGSLPTLRADSAAWRRLITDVARVVKEMPLWRLQVVGDEDREFLYSNARTGSTIRLKGSAVYCLRRFRHLISSLTQAAWIQFLRGLPRNRSLLGEAAELGEFLFGADRSALSAFRPTLIEAQAGRCFYCQRALRQEVAVDHFIPWSLYPLDLGHNLVAADAACNSKKSAHLGAFEHLRAWCDRNESAAFDQALQANRLPHDLKITNRVAAWAYGRASVTNTPVWQAGLRDLVPLEPAWSQLCLGEAA